MAEVAPPASSSHDGDDEDRWDRAAHDLLSGGGVAAVDLTPDVASLHAGCLRIARSALGVASAASSSSSSSSSGSASAVRTVRPEDGASSATGYHGAGAPGGLGRYNAHREGFVFSDGDLFDVPLTCGDGGGGEFEPSMRRLFESMHDVIAVGVLRAVERRLGIPPGWFQRTLGPTGASSQWHVKRYVDPPPPPDLPTTDGGGGDREEEGGDGSVVEWLPVHTDPSLVSVVLHDAPGKNPGAMGLQYKAMAPDDDGAGDDGRKRVWRDVPYHGHSVATVLTGSVLSYVTGGTFPAAKHRVVYSPKGGGGGGGGGRRVAATLFVRPRRDAALSVPPSPMLRGVRVRDITFARWIDRVSRNYTRKKRGGGSVRADDGDGSTRVPSDGRRAGAKAGGATDASSAADDGAAAGGDSSLPYYYRDAETELTLHPCRPPLRGREKFLGGELSPLNGRIYAVPGHYPRVLEIDPSVDPPSIRTVGPEFRGEYKWLRGVAMGDAIYGIPCHADSVLKISPGTGEVVALGWDPELPGAPDPGQRWKWHGGGVSPADGCFYAIPQSAPCVMKLNPETDEISFVGPRFEGTQLWYGGLVGNDGAIYGIPQNATGVLRIDPANQTATVHGSYPPGSHKWHGGVFHPPTGTIYGIPAHADSVLKIVPGPEPEITTFGGPLRTGAHRDGDGKYKYLGGAVGADGCAYLFPSDSDFVLRIDPETDEAREVGPNLRDLEPIRHNKWQNGFASQGGRVIYGIPLKASSVLRIVADPGGGGGEPEVTAVGGPYAGLNKWEGGVMCPRGDVYCMPLNHSMVLRMRPAGGDAGTVSAGSRGT